ncbi:MULTISPECIES: helix-turn-helix transcriptional regulator [unclassified Undibacterium]|uniref:helix-turn-helix transcriptional regulator n=1 Tax=unclassified Undibacterium TaxID=2630295 RepID=UPI002AC9F109|nr:MULTISPECIES: WYL domain-containing protein [unclassified Undibacterium]MEB0139129.1 WYL domain-containing protein [Undibacterium sp. CCC2.1]MEB0172891.1 WYL domain-containing protein [Undibacterium sp. CCC1.1]MEB0176637.1 WYL domain-containing protein [Undibacterium sp. CCC3.4]MEB0216035.1 WYL domain-containing protein [Undibacterium sp. 5I2]WPX43124.1 WYL domain-containing protein [Undibacterium sp. CCC3.4]
MNWPLRWDLLTRYRLIEIIAKWEGRLTTKHLCNSFGIGRQQASKDINAYLNDIAPGNLQYDKYLKGYVPTPQFVPKLTTGTADEYLHVLSRTKDIAHTFEGLDLGFAHTEMLHVPMRSIDPIILRALVQASREHRRVDLRYISLGTAIEEDRIIVPHTLVCTPLRWHVRAYCEKHGDYRDFVLSRFRGVPEIFGDSKQTAAEDQLWNTAVSLRIKPDSRLDLAQQELIARDFDMQDGYLEVKTRAPLVEYMLRAFNIDPRKQEMLPEAQQIVVENFRDIEKYLFKFRNLQLP